MIKKKIAFVTDFDGTISDQDFFHHLRDNIFDESALTPWNDYLDGKISHFDALKNIYGTLRICDNEIVDLVKKVTIDEWVTPTFKLLHEANVPIYIASAGCDYYINLLIGEEIKKYNITLITNPSSYSKETGLVMERPLKSHSYYDENIGISKERLVKQLQDNRQYVVFAGDGPPDFEPAKIADIVFAKKFLLEKCLKNNIKTEKFTSFKDIYLFFIKELKK
ncbi:MAG: MtnX-like HAD-IB family phosphatase [Erysipelotrichales bacterium]|nr:MtnX-like HAD-IB family phosphatase [Erysipelotrichales bacterium]